MASSFNKYKGSNHIKVVASHGIQQAFKYGIKAFINSFNQLKLMLRNQHKFMFM